MEDKVSLSIDSSGKVIIAFPFGSHLITKVKTIPDSISRPEEKYWSFPDSAGTLEKILKAFEGEEIHIDLALKGPLS